MKTLHLHIGYPKTGTSSIQATLYHNQELLNKHNFGLFNTRPDGTEETQQTPGQPLWVYHTKPYHSEYCFNGATHYTVNEIIEKEKLAKFLNAIPYNNVIFSSEYLIAAPQKELEALFPILKKYFDSILIYVYIRRQDRRDISAAQQNAHFSSINNNQFRALQSTQQHTSYFEKLCAWSTVFWKKNMRIRVFEKGRLINDDAVIDFFHTIGLADIISQINLFRRNESLGFERTKVGHILNSINIQDTLKDFIREHLDNTGKSLPSRKEAEEYYLPFRNSNILLNKEFNISSEYEAIFNDDFTDYPTEPADKWTEETANKAILNILNSVPELIEATVHLANDTIRKKHLKQNLEYEKLLLEKKL